VANVPLALRLVGPLDVDRMRDALRAAFARHPALREGFVSRGGGPSLASPLPLRTIDAMPAGRDAAVYEEARRPFDLGRGPLARSALLRVSPTEHVLVITAHHAVFDGWSAGALLRDVAAAYAGTATLAPRDAPPPPQSCGADAPSSRAIASTLPPEWPRLHGEVFASQREVDRWPGALVRDLTAVGRERNTTLFATILSAFLWVLRAHRGGPEFVIAVPVANRDRPEHADLVGLRASTILVRTDLSGADDLEDVLARVRSSAMEALTHRNAPIVRARAVVALQNAPLLRAPAFGALRAEMLPVDVGAITSELVLSLWPRTDGLDAILDSADSLLEPHTARGLLGELRAAAIDLASRGPGQ
jgi:hypothetical protein